MVSSLLKHSRNEKKKIVLYFRIKKKINVLERENRKVKDIWDNKK